MNPADAGAARWCALGAYYAERPEDEDGSYHFLVIAQKSVPAYSPDITFGSLNDGRNPNRSRSRCHREVLELYERAIELAEAQN